MNLVPAKKTFDALANLPHLLDRPFWAVAPLPANKAPHARLGLPRAILEPVAAAIHLEPDVALLPTVRTLPKAYRRLLARVRVQLRPLGIEAIPVQPSRKPELTGVPGGALGTTRPTPLVDQANEPLPIPSTPIPSPSRDVPDGLSLQLSREDEHTRITLCFNQAEEWNGEIYKEGFSDLGRQAMACLRRGWPRYAFEQTQEFPVGTPLELIGAYVGLCEAAARAGMSVRWATLQPVTLEVWLGNDQGLAAIDIYYGAAESPLLARVVEASSEVMAKNVFALLQKLTRPSDVAESTATSAVRALAPLPVIHVSNTGHLNSVSLRELCARIADERAAGPVELETLEEVADTGTVLQGQEHWIIDGVFATDGPAPKLRELTGVSVLHLQVDCDRFCRHDLLEDLAKDPFLRGILLAGFTWPDSDNLTLVVRLWPGRENYLPSREVLRRYFEEFHHYDGCPGEVDPTTCYCIMDEDADQTAWRPLLLSPESEYYIHAGLE